MYRMRGPLSMAGHRLKPELDAAARATQHLALVHEAERLHQQAASKFDPAAHRLRVAKCTRQLWEPAAGGVILAVWVWLSNGRQYRAAWKISASDTLLQSTWERVEWPFRGKASGRTTQDRRKAYSGLSRRRSGA